MRLILVRHGKPDELDTLQPGDPKLASVGWAQAEAVARVLATEDISHIVSSPLRRALDTAQPLSTLTGIPIQVISGWAEADRGGQKYRSIETLRSQGKEEWLRFLNDPITYLGADTENFRRDVLGALVETIKLAVKGTVVVFTHGMPINVILSHTLALNNLVTFSPGYCSVTRIRAKSLEAMSVVSVNELWHQPNLKS